ncbi:MAG: hypothetical protein HY000_06155 [Planctomycetes bacterium]|nr:hypothetical protein [Planctomycetota bacterium]
MRYEPGVERTLNLERQLLLWEQALEQLEKQFGFSLKRRLLVVVFATPKQARQLTRTTWATAAALMGDDLVVASVSSLGPHATETMRHELAHLFSASWLRLPNGLPFRDEGLATWIQGTVASSAVDHWAQMVARRGRLRPIGELFRMTRYPEAATEAFDLYVLAGSFAGYLIQTFGWESYRKFFGSVLAGNYSKVFSKVFGISLQEAEDQWLNQTLGCSGADVRVNRRLQMPYESLLKTVEQMSSKIERPRTLINLPERIAERRRQLYG